MQSEDNGYQYVMMCTPRSGNLQVVMYLYSEEVCLQPNSLTSTVSSLAEDARVDTAALVGCGLRHRVVVNQLQSSSTLPEGSRFTRVGSPPLKSVAWPVRATDSFQSVTCLE